MATIYNVTVNTSPSNGGTTTGGGSYTENSLCTIETNPNFSFAFSYWEKNNSIPESTNNTLSFNVTEDVSYTAIYVQVDDEKGKEVIVNIYGPGSVTGNRHYQTGTLCILTAIPDNNCVFEKWTIGQEVVSRNSKLIFTVTDDVTYNAYFIANPQSYNVALRVDPHDAGETIGSGSYLYNTQHTIEAIPYQSYIFNYWIDKHETNFITENPYTFNVTEDTIYTAIFSKVLPSHQITVQRLEDYNESSDSLYCYILESTSPNLDFNSMHPEIEGSHNSFWSYGYKSFDSFLRNSSIKEYSCNITENNYIIAYKINTPPRQSIERNNHLFISYNNGEKQELQLNSNITYQITSDNQLNYINLYLGQYYKVEITNVSDRSIAISCDVQNGLNGSLENISINKYESSYFYVSTDDNYLKLENITYSVSQQLKYAIYYDSIVDRGIYDNSPIILNDISEDTIIKFQLQTLLYNVEIDYTDSEFIGCNLNDVSFKYIINNVPLSNPDFNNGVNVTQDTTFAVEDGKFIYIKIILQNNIILDDILINGTSVHDQVYNSYIEISQINEDKTIRFSIRNRIPQVPHIRYSLKSIGINRQDIIDIFEQAGYTGPGIIVSDGDNSNTSYYPMNQMVKQPAIYISEFEEGDFGTNIFYNLSFIYFPNNAPIARYFEVTATNGIIQQTSVVPELYDFKFNTGNNPIPYISINEIYRYKEANNCIIENSYTNLHNLNDDNVIKSQTPLGVSFNGTINYNLSTLYSKGYYVDHVEAYKKENGNYDGDQFERVSYSFEDDGIGSLSLNSEATDDTFIILFIFNSKYPEMYTGDELESHSHDVHYKVDVKYNRAEKIIDWIPTIIVDN